MSFVDVMIKNTFSQLHKELTHSYILYMSQILIFFSFFLIEKYKFQQLDQIYYLNAKNVSLSNEI